MKRIFVPILISIIFISCNEKSSKVIPEEEAVPSQSIVEDVRNEPPQNEPSPIEEYITVREFNPQKEFNAYEYSQAIWDFFNRTKYLNGYAWHPFELSALVAFSREELRLLREYLEESLQRGGLGGFIPDDYLNAVYEYNINIIKIVEDNFPNENEINNTLKGLWCLAYMIPDQGYRRGDYLKLYNNGIFEYISRDFQATRYEKLIYGGSNFGLWTTDTGKDQAHYQDIDILIISEFEEIGRRLYYNIIDISISVFDDSWMKISNDINHELDWGYRY
jgi:hypothetical protein